MYITCPSGLETLLQQELESFGIRDVRLGYRGVFTPQTMRDVYTINYRSRIATRALWPLTKFHCTDKDALYHAAKKIDWPRLIDPRKTFAIDANVAHPNLRNSLFAAQVVKDALCDRIKEKYGTRPSVDTAAPDVQINLFIHNSTGIISFDTSGAALYKRGYRTEATTAPLQESLAAAILMQAGYTRDAIFCDPFCGSGTFLIEAAMMATDTPAGFFRKEWGFFKMPGFSKAEWEKVKEAADSAKSALPKGKIFGADIDPQATTLSRKHLKTTGFEESLNIQQKDVALYQPSATPTLVVSNPPYGRRLPVSLETYRALGRFLSARCAPDVKVHILNTEEPLINAIGHNLKKGAALFNGGLDISVYHN